MAEFTPNYGLHQWEPTDHFLRTDFNTDFEKIDTALGQKAEQSSVNSQYTSVTNRLSSLEGRLQVIIGSYTGNGAASQNIYLGFQPKAVLIENQVGQRTYNSGIHGGLATPDVPLKNNDIMAMEVTSSGFRVYYTQYKSNTNASGQKFIYLAFK